MSATYVAVIICFVLSVMFACRLSKHNMFTVGWFACLMAAVSMSMGAVVMVLGSLYGPREGFDGSVAMEFIAAGALSMFVVWCNESRQ